MRPLNTRRAMVLALAGAGLVLAACSTAPGEAAHNSHSGHAAQESPLGVLIMAHGGGAAWNSQVEAMLAPVGKDYPLEIAFGMADAASLQAGVEKLEARGAERIAVVRLFISGESWYERTEQILGVAPGAPARPEPAGHAGHGAHAGHSMEFWRLSTEASFAMSKEGLADAPEMGAVLVERVRTLSREPAKESVLIIGHGPETDEENERWLKLIDQRADAVRSAGAFREVHVETLREDWPEKRAASVERIRAFVDQASKDGGRVLVIPYRVAGFGPYADVLKDLPYEADKTGLLPSVEVEHWVRRQIRELDTAAFRKPVQQAHSH